MHNKLVLFFLFFDIPNEKSQVEKYQWKNEKGGKNALKGISLNFYFHIHRFVHLAPRYNESS